MRLHESLRWVTGLSDDLSLYFHQDAPFSGGALVGKLSKQGGSPVTLVDGLSMPWSILVDGGYFYFSTVEPNGDQALVRVPVQGGSSQKLLSGNYAFGDVLPEGDTLYFTDRLITCDPQPDNCLMGFLYRTSLTGAAPVALARNELGMGTLFHDEQAFYWNRDEDDTLTRTPTFHGIRRLSRAGGNPTTLLEGERITTIILTREGYFYWTDWTMGDGAHRIRRMKKEGGAVETVVSGQHQPVAMYADAQHLYWGTRESTLVNVSLRRVPLAGGQVEELLEMQGGSIASIAGDNASVYFSVLNELGIEQGVFRLAK